MLAWSRPERTVCPRLVVSQFHSPGASFTLCPRCFMLPAAATAISHRLSGSKRPILNQKWSTPDADRSCEVTSGSTRTRADRGSVGDHHRVLSGVPHLFLSVIRRGDDWRRSTGTIGDSAAALLPGPRRPAGLGHHRTRGISANRAVGARERGH